jgi:hypothetical protein
MPRFLAVVKLSPAALQDLAGPRQRFEQVRCYLARRGIRLSLTFRLDGAYHLFVLEALESPTRLLNRALAQAWPDLRERPEHARLISADPWPAGGGLAGRPAVAAAMAQPSAAAQPPAVAQPSVAAPAAAVAQPSVAARSASHLPSRRARSALTSRSSRSSSSPR